MSWGVYFVLFKCLMRVKLQHIFTLFSAHFCFILGVFQKKWIYSAISFFQTWSCLDQFFQVNIKVVNLSLRRLLFRVTESWSWDPIWSCWLIRLRLEPTSIISFLDISGRRVAVEKSMGMKRRLACAYHESLLLNLMPYTLNDDLIIPHSHPKWSLLFQP